MTIIGKQMEPRALVLIGQVLFEQIPDQQPESPGKHQCQDPVNEKHGPGKSLKSMKHQHTGHEQQRGNPHRPDKPPQIAETGITKHAPVKLHYKKHQRFQGNSNRQQIKKLIQQGVGQNKLKPDEIGAEQREREQNQIDKKYHIKINIFQLYNLHFAL